MDDGCGGCPNHIQQDEFENVLAVVFNVFLQIVDAYSVGFFHTIAAAAAAFGGLFVFVFDLDDGCVCFHGQKRLEEFAKDKGFHRFVHGHFHKSGHGLIRGNANVGVLKTGHDEFQDFLFLSHHRDFDAFPFGFGQFFLG